MSVATTLAGPLTDMTSQTGMPLETSTVSDSTHQLGQVNLTPHEVACSVKVSRLLLRQETPAASALITSDLLAEVGGDAGRTTAVGVHGLLDETLGAVPRRDVVGVGVAHLQPRPD